MKKNNLILPGHGGCLNQAMEKYAAEPGCPDKSHWLDLSTGVNPNGWPVPIIPANERQWQRLEWVLNDIS